MSNNSVKWSFQDFNTKLNDPDDDIRYIGVVELNKHLESIDILDLQSMTKYLISLIVNLFSPIVQDLVNVALRSIVLLSIHLPVDDLSSLIDQILSLSYLDDCSIRPQFLAIFSEIFDQVISSKEDRQQKIKNVFFPRLEQHLSQIDSPTTLFSLDVLSSLVNSLGFTLSLEDMTGISNIIKKYLVNESSDIIISLSNLFKYWSVIVPQEVFEEFLNTTLLSQEFLKTNPNLPDNSLQLIIAITCYNSNILSHFSETILNLMCSKIEETESERTKRLEEDPDSDSTNDSAFKKYISVIQGALTSLSNLIKTFPDVTKNHMKKLLNFAFHYLLFNSNATEESDDENVEETSDNEFGDDNDELAAEEIQLATGEESWKIRQASILLLSISADVFPNFTISALLGPKYNPNPQENENEEEDSEGLNLEYIPFMIKDFDDGAQKAAFEFLLKIVQKFKKNIDREYIEYWMNILCKYFKYMKDRPNIDTVLINTLNQYIILAETIPKEIAETAINYLLKYIPSNSIFDVIELLMTMIPRIYHNSSKNGPKINPDPNNYNSQGLSNKDINSQDENDLVQLIPAITQIILSKSFLNSSERQIVISTLPLIEILVYYSPNTFSEKSEISENANENNEEEEVERKNSDIDVVGNLLAIENCLLSLCADNEIINLLLSPLSFFVAYYPMLSSTETAMELICSHLDSPTTVNSTSQALLFIIQVNPDLTLFQRFSTIIVEQIFKLYNAEFELSLSQSQRQSQYQNEGKAYVIPLILLLLQNDLIDSTKYETLIDFLSSHFTAYGNNQTLILKSLSIMNTEVDENNILQDIRSLSCDSTISDQLLDAIAEFLSNYVKQSGNDNNERVENICSFIQSLYIDALSKNNYQTTRMIGAVSANLPQMITDIEENALADNNSFKILALGELGVWYNISSRPELIDKMLNIMNDNTASRELFEAAGKALGLSAIGATKEILPIILQQAENQKDFLLKWLIPINEFLQRCNDNFGNNNPELSEQISNFLFAKAISSKDTSTTIAECLSTLALKKDGFYIELISHLPKSLSEISEKPDAAVITQALALFSQKPNLSSSILISLISPVLKLISPVTPEVTGFALLVIRSALKVLFVKLSIHSSISTYNLSSLESSENEELSENNESAIEELRESIKLIVTCCALNEAHFKEVSYGVDTRIIDIGKQTRLIAMEIIGILWEKNKDMLGIPNAIEAIIIALDMNEKVPEMKTKAFDLIIKISNSFKGNKAREYHDLIENMINGLENYYNQSQQPEEEILLSQELMKHFLTTLLFLEAGLQHSKSPKLEKLINYYEVDQNPKYKDILTQIHDNMGFSQKQISNTKTKAKSNLRAEILADTEMYSLFLN